MQPSLTSKRLWDRIVTVALALSIAATIGAAVFAGDTGRSQERFTEFFILNAAGSADHSRKLVAGEIGTVTLVAVNREGERTDYEVNVVIKGERVQEIRGITLEDRGRWEQKISFGFGEAGPGQRVDFLLRKPFGVEPYRAVYLRIDVTDKP